MTVDNAHDLVMSGFKQLGFIQFTGIDGVEGGDGRTVIAMAPKPEHLNHNGDVHAALLFGMGETSSMGAAVSGLMHLLANAYIVTRGGQIEYLARAKGTEGPFTSTSDIPADAYARARADVEAGVPVDLPVPFSIANADGKEVAHGSFAAIIRPRRD